MMATNRMKIAEKIRNLLFWVLGLAAFAPSFIIAYKIYYYYQFPESRIELTSLLLLVLYTGLIGFILFKYRDPQSRTLFPFIFFPLIMIIFFVSESHYNFLEPDNLIISVQPALRKPGNLNFHWAFGEVSGEIEDLKKLIESLIDKEDCQSISEQAELKYRAIEELFSYAARMFEDNRNLLNDGKIKYYQNEIKDLETRLSVCKERLQKLGVEL